MLYGFLAASLSTLLIGSSSETYSYYTKPHNNPGPAADVVNFSAFDQGIASKELEAGNMDMYIYSLKTPAAEALKNHMDINVYKAPASTVSIILNPAPAPAGELNPLSIKKVRQALQYAVNRKFISQEIYKGFASPMVSQVSSADFDYLTVFNLLKESKITYDLDSAINQVNDAMIAAGAELNEGYWHFDENIVNNVLDQYDWERAPDTNTTWRIGDGTAAFYNYIYYNALP